MEGGVEILISLFPAFTHVGHTLTNTNTTNNSSKGRVIHVNSQNEMKMCPYE